MSDEVQLVVASTEAVADPPRRRRKKSQGATSRSQDRTEVVAPAEAPVAQVLEEKTPEREPDGWTEADYRFFAGLPMKGR